MVLGRLERLCRTHCSIIDKAENNPLTVKAHGNRPTHPGWVQWLNLKTGKSLALDALTNRYASRKCHSLPRLRQSLVSALVDRGS